MLTRRHQIDAATVGVVGSGHLQKFKSDTPKKLKGNIRLLASKMDG